MDQIGPPTGPQPAPRDQAGLEMPPIEEAAGMEEKTQRSYEESRQTLPSV